MKNSTRTKMLLAGAAMALGMAVSAPANATLILQTGLVGGSGDVSNVIFNACGLGSSTGTTVQGCLNDSNTTLVNFTSNESLTIGGGGQAVIDSGDGVFDRMTIALADPTMGFSKLQFNLDAIADGSATFEATDQFGTVFSFGSFALSGNGQNFFTLGSLDGQIAKSFSLLATVGLQNIGDLTQVRVGAATVPSGVPEPGSLALLGLLPPGHGHRDPQKESVDRRRGDEGGGGRVAVLFSHLAEALCSRDAA